MNSASFSKVCARISAELIALENEQRLARLDDPQHRAFLVALYRLALTDDDDFTVSARGGTFPRWGLPSQWAPGEETEIFGEDLGISRDRLKKLVLLHGPMVKDVKKALGK